MGLIDITIATATLTNAATVTQTIAHNFKDTFEGTLTFAVSCVEDSGTLDGDCQLQGSTDNVSWIDIGSTVAIADATTVPVPLGGIVLSYNYYRITILGVGTQSTSVDTRFTAKFK